MAEEKLNVLYTIDDKEFPSMDYINVLEKMKTLSEEYEEPFDLITKITECSPGDEGMDIWLEALDTFFCGDAELIEYVQKVIGLAAIGKVSERTPRNTKEGTRMAGKSGLRRDSKHRVLRRGESIRANGKYQFKYHIGGKPHFVYSWRLEPTDPLPVGKKPCLSLRELEKQIGYDLDNRLDPLGKNITVNELVERYLKTKVGMRPNTLANYNFVRNILKNEPFGSQKISKIKTSDAKLFLIKMQQEDGRGHSTIKTVRGVLRPAFQMAVDDDVVYCKYYEVIYILFHTGMRISEFCGLTMRDIDLEKRTINIDHQLQRTSKREYVIEPTKTNAGTRVIPMTNEVTEMFRAIIEDRPDYKVEKVVDGYTGFLFLDKDGMPLVAMHWEHRFNHMVSRYNEIYKVQIPNITPHVCRHTYCSNMAKSGMNPKTLQYLMGHSDIAVTLNVYIHVGLEDAEKELQKMQGLENVRKEMGISDTDDKPLKQNMFKVV